MSKIKLTLEGLSFEAELYDFPQSEALLKELPLKASLSRWGEEYYGGIGDLDIAKGEDARDLMKLGELAYWKPGKAFCIFFGPTPASHSDEPRAASEVLPLGRMTTEDYQSLSALGPQIEVSIEAI